MHPHRWFFIQWDYKLLRRPWTLSIVNNLSYLGRFWDIISDHFVDKSGGASISPTKVHVTFLPSGGSAVLPVLVSGELEMRSAPRRSSAW